MAQQVMERTKGTSAIEGFRDRLQVRRHELIAALKGTGIDVDRFIRTAVSAAQNNPALVTDCSFPSLWNELLKACRDRLLPDGRQGVIVAYKGRASWQPMYRGLLDRFEQSGEYRWITANLHREDDIAWDVWIDETGQHFLHRPGPGHGKVIATYAAATTKSGAFFLTVVDERDMDHIRSVSRAKSDDAPWQQWQDQMRLKTAIKRLCKMLPMPQPLEDLIADSEDDAPPLAPVTPTKPLSRARGAANALEQFASEPEPEVKDQPDQPDMLPDPTEEPGRVPTVSQVMLDTAHERGIQAKRDGHKRTAMPGEYRAADRADEATAWRAGWDSVPPKAAGGDNEAQ